MTKKTMSVLAVFISMTIAANADVVFYDTYTDTVPGAYLNDAVNSANAGYPVRQSGGTMTSTYTCPAGKLYSGTGAAAGAGLTGPCLLMRSTYITSGGNAFSGAVLGTDFSSGLSSADNWTLSFTGYYEYAGEPGYNYLDVIVGQYDAGTGVASGGCSARLRTDGLIQLYTGTTLAANLWLPEEMRTIFQAQYTLTLEFDEAADTVVVNFENAAGSYTSGTYSTAFADTSRYVKFLNLAYNTPAAARADWRIDDLKLETIPEPTTVGLFGISSVLIFFVRRATR